MPGAALAPGDSVVNEIVKFLPLLRHTEEKKKSKCIPTLTSLPERRKIK